MRINPQAKTAASYAKLFKEKIEQSRENTTRSNGISENSKQEKPTVKGIKFDELSDWDNIVYDKKNDNNNVNNNNDNNNNPLSDFSVNTSTFTYRVNEMGGCDKIDLSTMNSNEGNIAMNQKMKMFNANTNMISQIKQSNRNDIPEDINSNVIKEEEDEYKNYSKNTFNEKDSLNEEENNNINSNYNKVNLVPVTYPISNNNIEENNDSIISGKDLMKQIEDENNLTNMQLNDLAEEAGIKPIQDKPKPNNYANITPIISQPKSVIPSYPNNIYQKEIKSPYVNTNNIQPITTTLSNPIPIQPTMINNNPITQQMSMSNTPINYTGTFSPKLEDPANQVNVINNVNNNYNNVNWMHPYQMPYYPYPPQQIIYPPQMQVEPNSNMFTFNVDNNLQQQQQKESKSLPKIKKKVSYKPKTMKDYKEKYIKEAKNEKRGGLGPNIGTKEWEEKEEKMKKIQEYSNKIKQLNKMKKQSISIRAINKDSTVRDQLYDSLSENDTKDNINDTSKRSQRSIQSAGGYGHINMIKQLRKENQSKQNNKNKNYKPVPIKNTNVEDTKQKEKIYTTYKAPVIKEKRRAKSGKIRINTQKKIDNKNNNTPYDDELTKMFLMNRPNDYNGLKMLSETNENSNNINSNTKYKRSNSKSDLQGNFELETLLVNHKKYYEQIGKIKEFIKNIK